MPSGSAMKSATPSAAAESSSCSAAFVRMRSGFSTMNRERLEERVRVGGVEDHPVSALVHGTAARRTSTSAASHVSARPTASTPAAQISVLNGIGSWIA